MEQPEHDCLAGTPLSSWYATLAEPCPDALAIDNGVEKVAYAELDRRSDACAAALAGHGVTSETLVAVAMERTPLLVATLLGIWKAGAPTCQSIWIIPPSAAATSSRTRARHCS